MPNTAAKRVHVAVGVICKGTEILLALRPAKSHMGGLWEFPGGKLDGDETVQTALVRELQEELGITPMAFESITQIRHDYPDKQVLLDVWRVTQFSGSPEGKEGQEIRWVPLTELDQYQFPAANEAIVQALML